MSPRPALQELRRSQPNNSLPGSQGKFRSLATPIAALFEAFRRAGLESRRFPFTLAGSWLPHAAVRMCTPPRRIRIYPTSANLSAGSVHPSSDAGGHERWCDNVEG